MDEFEQKLRDSLQARAQDVEPTPQLWRRVEDEMRTRTWHSRWLVIVGVAAAAVVAAVAVPAILDGPTNPVVGEDPAIVGSPDDGPSEEPGDTADPERPAPGESPVDGEDEVPADDHPTAPDDAATIPGHIVATDGTAITLRRSDGQLDAVLHHEPADTEVTIVAVAVRPGSTLDDLDIVYLEAGEGMYVLRWLAVGGDTETNEALPDHLNIHNEVPADPQAAPIPHFSPDGRHLAWIERPADEDGAVRLRTIGWTDAGPGTGRTADDNAAFELPTLPNGVAYRVEDWVWADEGEATTGSLLVTSTDLQAYEVPIERQADGALTAGGAVRLVERPDAAVIDLAGELVDGGAIRYELTARGSGSQDAESVSLRLQRWNPDGATVELPVPDELARTASPGDIWMSAVEEAVLIGAGGRAWLVTADGAQALADGEALTAAAFLR